MKYSKFIRSSTLLGFAILIAVFVYYRTGTLNKFFARSTLALPLAATDTTGINTGANKQRATPASPSLVFTDPSTRFFDSISAKTKGRRTETEMLSSSKSITMIRIEPITYRPSIPWDSIFMVPDSPNGKKARKP
jgi:hypothetical protein